MDKKHKLPEILITIGIAVVFFAGYYGVKLMLTVSSPAIGKSTIIDAKTGLPLSNVEVSAIAKKQEREMTTHTLIGEVTIKLRDSLQVEAVVRDTVRVLHVKFSPKTVFLKSMSATEEKEISFDDVNVGDTVTMIFPQGLFLSEIGETGIVVVDNLTVNMPLPPGVAND